MSDIVDEMIDKEFPQLETKVKFCPYCGETTIDTSRIFKVLHLCTSCKTTFCIADTETLHKEQMEKAGFKEKKEK
jgi:predicted RNA-binding Zn-ribbon protein involved in translation (DUF1610 family)